MEELKRFLKDIEGSIELQKKMDEICVRLKDEGQVKSDGDLIVTAAKELGYTFTVADLDRNAAEAEILDPEEMAAVSGGHEDEYGHDSWCVAAWHCLLAFLHTEAETPTACFFDYTCGTLHH